MSRIYTCTCGFQWEHGKSGAHQCEPFYRKRIEALEKQNAELLAAVWAKQAAIDLLMLEYCPNEMSPEQIAEWAKHQRPSTQEVSE